jgi:hypothetical protein
VADPKQRDMVAVYNPRTEIMAQARLRLAGFSMRALGKREQFVLSRSRVRHRR